MTRRPPGKGTKGDPFLVPSVEYWNIKRKLECMVKIFEITPEDAKPAIRTNFRNQLLLEWPWLYDDCYLQEW